MTLPYKSVLLGVLLSQSIAADDSLSNSHFRVPPDPFPEAETETKPASEKPHSGLSEPAGEHAQNSRHEATPPSSQKPAGHVQSSPGKPQENAKPPHTESPGNQKPGPEKIPAVVSAKPEKPSKPLKQSAPPKTKIPHERLPLTVAGLISSIPNSAGRLRIEVANGMAVGQTLDFRVTSKTNCYLTVLILGEDGSQQIVFPNRGQSNNFLRAGRPLQIPDPKASEQLAFVSGGKETLVALCQAQNSPVLRGGYDFRKEPYVSLQTGKTLDQQLSINLPLTDWGDWAVATIKVKDYPIRYE